MARYEPYVEELREFFASRNLPIGKPADLLTLLGRLHDEAFREEMVSMVRSILYREEILPKVALVEIIATAAAGPQVMDDAAELRPTLRALLDFVQGIGRAGSSPPLEEAAAAMESSAPPLPLELSTDAPAPTADPAVLASSSAPSLPPNGNLSRNLALMQAATEENAAREKAARVPSQTAAPRRNVVSPRARGRAKSRPFLTSLLRRNYWIPGVIMLLLAVGAAMFLSRSSKAPESAASPSAVEEAAPSPAAPGRGNAVQQGAQQGSQQQGYGPEPAEEGIATVRSSPPAATSRVASGPAPALSTRRTPNATRSSPRSSLPAQPSSTNPLAPREGVFLASSGVMASHLLSAPAPEYPKLASLTRTEGQVIVQVVIGRDGKVSATRVLDGPHLLRGAAEHAIRQWRYRPYLLDGRPTDVATLVTVSFRLRAEPPPVRQAQNARPSSHAKTH